MHDFDPDDIKMTRKLYTCTIYTKRPYNAIREVMWLQVIKRIPLSYFRGNSVLGTHLRLSGTEGCPFNDIVHATFSNVMNVGITVARQK